MTQDAVASLKAQLRELDVQRQAIEAEVEERSARLNAPGMPGLKGSLVDKEGYPRSDIDVLAVRTDRNRIACLSNDHKALSSQIEGLLKQLHALTRQQQGSAAPPELAPAITTLPSRQQPTAAAPGAAPAQAPTATASGVAGDAEMEDARALAAQPHEPLVPFALIDELSEGSPASSAGLQVGDLLCRFGDVVAPALASGSTGGSGQELLQQVAATLQASEGTAVEAVVLRHGHPLTLRLVPQRWAGRGLLGCHLQPTGA